LLLLKASAKPLKLKNFISGHIELLKMSKFGFLFSYKKCINKNIYISISDKDHRWNLNNYLLKIKTPVQLP